jgi:hypothetical protein
MSCTWGQPRDRRKLETRFLRIFLEGVCTGNTEDKDVDYFCSFQLKGTIFKEEERLMIWDQSFYLFTHKVERNQHNKAKLFELHSEVNPFAKIKASYAYTQAMYKSLHLRWWTTKVSMTMHQSCRIIVSTYYLTRMGLLALLPVISDSWFLLDDLPRLDVGCRTNWPANRGSFPITLRSKSQNIPCRRGSQKNPQITHSFPNDCPPPLCMPALSFWSFDS